MNDFLFFPPRTDKDWLEWGAIHQSDHLEIAQQIFQRTGQIASVLPIDPIPFEEPIGWLRNHQAVHNEMLAPLGLSGFDLTSVDFQEDDQLIVWVQLHAEEHFAVSARLAELEFTPPAQPTPSAAPSFDVGPWWHRGAGGF